MISTKGRYALRVVTDLAKRYDGNYVPLKDIVSRQGISQKYLESITTDLVKAGLLLGIRGKGGGYKLALPPDKLTVWDVLSVSEGDLAPISCLKETAAPCSRADECCTLPMWENFYSMMRDYFGGITVEDLTTGANDNMRRK